MKKLGTIINIKKQDYKYIYVTDTQYQTWRIPKKKAKAGIFVRGIFKKVKLK